MIAPGLQRTPPSSETSSKPTSRHLEETEYSEAGSDAVKSWLNEVQTDMHLGMVSRNPRSLTYKSSLMLHSNYSRYRSIKTLTNFDAFARASHVSVQRHQEPGTVPYLD